jgi:hypothetical protein
MSMTNSSGSIGNRTYDLPACSPAPKPTEFKAVSCKGNIYVWKLVIIEYVIKTKLICVIVSVSRFCMQFFLSDDIEGSVT